MSVDDLIRLYEEKHNAIFTKTVWGTAAGGIVVGSVAAALLGVVAGPVVGIALGVILGVLTPQLAVPKYNNRPMRCILKSVLGDASLASCRRDVLITAKDTVRSETTYFTAFHSPGSVRGTYRDVRLREAIAASAGSAPTYFASIGRFIDGGVGGYNNTAYVAAVEALRYSGTPTVAGHTDGVGNADPNGPWPLYGIQDPHGAGADQLYQAKHTRVVSFNTGAQANNMKVGQASKIHLALQWLGFLIGEGMQDANEQQSYVARNELDLEEGAIQFQRFEVHFTQPAFDVLRGIDPTLPAGVQGSDFEMDAASHFGLMSQVGAAFGEWLMRLEGSTVRFDLPGMVRLGEPGRVEPAKYHISVYAPEVRQELHDENP
jgi:hypothetical protein